MGSRAVNGIWGWHPSCTVDGEIDLGAEMSKTKHGILGSGATLALIVAGAMAQGQPTVDIERELEEAKVLYSEARFARAATKLQGVIVRLEQL